MERIKLLGISASPRGDANSMFLLKKALEGAKSVELSGFSLDIEVFSFRERIFHSCKHCYACERSKGDCIIKDDFGELRDKWLEADSVIYSVPVYHGTIPGQVRCFHDRLGMSLSKKYYSRKAEDKVFFPSRYHLKVIGNIAQGMDIFSGQERALEELIMHSVLMNCIPISGDAYFGAGGWTLKSRNKNEIESLAKEGEFCAQCTITEAFSIGKRIVQIAAILNLGLKEARDLIASDDTFLPVFDRLGWLKK